MYLPNILLWSCIIVGSILFNVFLNRTRPDLSVERNGTRPLLAVCVYSLSYLVAMTVGGVAATFLYASKPLSEDIVRRGLYEIGVATLFLGVGILIHVKAWRQFPR